MNITIIFICKLCDYATKASDLPFQEFIKPTLNAKFWKLLNFLKNCK